VDLNKNCREYTTQGKVDSDNVEIRYSADGVIMMSHLFG